MRQSTPQPPNYWLRRNPALSNLLRESERLAVLESLLRQQLDPALAPHFQLLQADPGSVTLAASTAAWAARLRFHSRHILSALHSETGIASRQVKVLVRRPPVVATSRQDTTPTAAKRHLPTSTARLLKHTARALDQEAPALSAALRRLARHAPGAE